MGEVMFVITLIVPTLLALGVFVFGFGLLIQESRIKRKNTRVNAGAIGIGLIALGAILFVLVGILWDHMLKF